MLNVTLNKYKSIAVLEPHGSLKKDDFDAAVKIIDPYIEKNGRLNGLIISTESFPGWNDFAALSRHITFVKNHHKKIKRLAFVTDSVLGDLSEKLADHFVEAEIKTFPFGKMNEATAWIEAGS
ncbi:MAG: STAS/SEC14 domain-containing protein [Campylobacterota bacterium]|nr:STAS/SEC14 domain-containing protein [Campylobacterota bacterium]